MAFHFNIVDYKEKIHDKQLKLYVKVHVFEVFS